MPPSHSTHVLARLRAKEGLTQTQMGRKLGYSPATIKAIEIGRLEMSPAFALKVVTTFNLKFPPIDLDLEPWL